ncbi:hypothetical protein ASE95_16985 [Sphingomonas sp. Leaf231]|uniref:glycosyltransferase family 2 protein n=1 Tax=Sphingomonas sp. Leaf231 TaxID=1736301 RepID=UPI0006F4F33E|nr:glycosyltransferase family 2 protein [Sphingomonas sp. Leaf231]KQN89859.1 hypothetical protein ASE95_16985 [Sphingomonas sp. Leaf231]
MSALPLRHALDDHDHVRSNVRFEGRLHPAPVITFAIPTFNRPTLATEAIASVLAQTHAVPIEILIVDNASDPDNVRSLTKALSRMDDPPLRYLVNDTNIGMFPNWNRCVKEARGRWITILNDDDLLVPAFLDRMLAHIDLARGDTAYTCDVSILDQREARPRRRRIAPALSATKGLIRSGGRSLVPITPQKLFWAHVSGTGLGMIFPKAMIEKLGGFYPEDHPTADYFFHVRLASAGRLYRVPERLGVMRVQVNESQKPATLLGFLVNNLRLRSALIQAGMVPASWARYLPALISRERRAFARMWGVPLSRSDVQAATGVAERSGNARDIVILLRRLWHGAV